MESVEALAGVVGALEGLRHAGGFVPFDGEAPEGVHCWTGTLRDGSCGVTILLDHEPASDLDLEFVDGICADAAGWIARAEQAAGLEARPEGWLPEFSFRTHRVWHLHLADAPGPTELGVMVLFEGETVIEVDDLAEADW